MRLQFENEDAVDHTSSLEVKNRTQAEMVSRWYHAFYAGDRISVYLDGKDMYANADGDFCCR